MTTTKNTYYVLSGEGENVSWERVETTELGIRQRLTQERCGGDRWAKAYSDAYETADGVYAGYDVESGEVRAIPSDMAKA